MSHPPHTAPTERARPESGGGGSSASPLPAEEPPSTGDAEPDLLEAIARSLRAWGHALDHGDDCALLGAGEGAQLLTTDALAEGVHFDLAWDTLEQVGAQAAVVNLSDLAASGGRPRALLWSLSLPPSLSVEQVGALAWGFARVAARWDAPVLGGNLCVRPGPLEVHVTALGAVEGRRLHRSGARAGDALFVTGALGARALGYLEPSEASRALRHQWRPHLSESAALASWGGVTAMMDISDGLLLDAHRIAAASDVELSITSALLPVCARMSALASTPEVALRAALSGGEDYVLLFTARGEPPPEAHATQIGECLRAARPSTSRLSLDGEPVAPRGYEHTLGAPALLPHSPPLPALP